MTHRFSLVRVGRWMMVVGLSVTVLSMIAGFSFLLADLDSWAKRFLPLVPIGFLLLFTGLVTVVLSEPRSDDAA